MHEYIELGVQSGYSALPPSAEILSNAWYMGIPDTIILLVLVGVLRLLQTCGGVGEGTMVNEPWRPLANTR